METQDKTEFKENANNAPAQMSPFNFHKGSIISEYLVRALRNKQSEFADSLCNRLSLYLHSEYEIKIQSVGIISFQKWLNNLTAPTFVTYYKIEPLRGIGFVEIQLDLGFRICERMLGGKPMVIESNRQPTDIEVVLLDQVIQLMLEEWCAQWSKYQQLRPLILGNESDTKFLTLLPPDTKMFVSFFNVNFCGVSRDVCFAVQLETIEPFFEKLKPPVETQISNQTTIDNSKVIWNPVFDDVPVFITANWDTLEMKAREISNLKIGDVITLNGDYSETIKLQIGGIEKFGGRLGTQNGKWAVELTRPIKKS